MTRPELCSRESFALGRASLWLLALALAAPVVRAEPHGEPEPHSQPNGTPHGEPYGTPIYVIEQLVVSVANVPEPDGERIGQVKSGDKLELIERQGEEAHVRLPGGKEGWIKASYLSTEQPLQYRLTERTAEVEKLKQEGDKLKQDVGRLQSELAAASRVAHNVVSAPVSTSGATSGATPAGTPKAANTPQETIPPPVADALSGGSTPMRETVFLRSPERPGQTPWPLVLGTSFVMLLAGFVLGWRTLDRRIRRKYGGLRIY
jgi:Bacterial SH3 domain